MNRREAMAAGVSRYQMDKPCKRGHMGDALVNGGCIECRYIRYKSEPYKEVARERYALHPEKVNERSRNYNQRPEVKEANRERQKRDRKDSTKREKMNQSCRGWYERNKDNKLIANRLQEIARLNRVPIWSELDEIKQFYLDCPEGCHVDHIIPLQGRLVSGLHVLDNLQYLTARENLSKSNHFDPL